MPLEAHLFRRIFTRFFPRKVSSSLAAEEYKPEHLSPEQKKELSLRYLADGELSLLQGNLRALSCFEHASNLDSGNAKVWYRQGLAFFEYGSEEGKEGRGPPPSRV